MPRVPCAVLAIGLAFAAGPVHADVDVEYIGHACFVVISPGGVRVLIDPFNSNRWLGYGFPDGVEADAVLITHPHYDHDASDAGARSAGYILIRLPLEVKGLFTEWLQTEYPARAGPSPGPARHGTLPGTDRRRRAGVALRAIFGPTAGGR